MNKEQVIKPIGGYFELELPKFRSFINMPLPSTAVDSAWSI